MSDDEEVRPRPRRARTKRDEATAPARVAPVRAALASVAVVAAPPPSEAAVRRPLVASSVAAAVGLAIVGTSTHALGPWILSAGVIGLVASIHRLGRLGPT